MTEEIQSSQPEAQAPVESAPVENTQQENSFTVPDDYKDRGWVEKIKSPEDLWKTLDNAQSLIGKRPAGIPSDNASDDEWDQFYTAMGRPSEPEYEFTDPEGLPEGFDTSSFKEQAANILHAAGLNQKQADKVYQAYLNLEMQSTSSKQEQLDARFDELTKEHFGEDFEKYSEMTKSDFDKYVPQDLKSSFASLQDHPEALAALMSYTKGKNAEIDRIRQEYTGEGNLTSGTQTQSISRDEVLNQLTQLRMSKEVRDFTHPNHKESMARLKELEASYNRK